MSTFPRWSLLRTTKYLLLILWLSGCGVLFWRTYRYYQYEPSFYYVHQLLGSCLCISRAAAAVLNLTCGMALLPVCRVTVTTLRHLNAKIKLRTMRMLLDCCKGFHISCAYVIVITSVIHFSAHMWNARNFSVYFDHVIRDVNAAVHPDEDPLWILLKTIPGVTGILMMIMLSLILSSSVSNIRNVNYDLFWYTHRLFVLFYILLLIHALKGPIRKQTNISSHTPGCPLQNNTAGNLTISYVNAVTRNANEPLPEAEYNIRTACEDKPRFTQIGCYSWLWVSGPLLVYVCDMVYRFMKRLARVKIVSVTDHPCDVVEIQLERAGFKAKPGQFILLQCPRISTFEWHPFSLTMCPVPGRPTFSVHIRTRGDWSENLRNLLLNSRDALDGEDNDMLRYSLRVDGPFCSPMEDLKKYRVVLCIAGGIGVTPFISLLTAISDDANGCIRRPLLASQYHPLLVKCQAVLTYLMLFIYMSYVPVPMFMLMATDLTDNDVHPWGEQGDGKKWTKKLNRVYFVWVSRESESFSWFSHLIRNCHMYCWQNNRPDLLDIRLYCTGHNNYECDDFLLKRLYKGRPNWNDILSHVKCAHKRFDIGVFSCGPHGLVNDVKHCCAQQNVHPARLYHYHETY